jgi:hypothetical protein
MNDDVDVVTERGSEVRINAVTGTTYYFMVAGYDNDEPGGRFEFALSVRLRVNAEKLATPNSQNRMLFFVSFPLSSSANV